MNSLENKRINMAADMSPMTVSVFTTQSISTIQYGFFSYRAYDCYIA